MMLSGLGQRVFARVYFETVAQDQTVLGTVVAFFFITFLQVVIFIVQIAALTRCTKLCIHA